MTLTVGQRLGQYEVTGSLGAGGMGEVYRARDTTLSRDVAIKVLPSAAANDPERLARFRREAEVLASLNHPNIASIYGLAEGVITSASAETGPHMRALVMELVEGPTLADRIAQGAVPQDEALPIARQIAEALEAAHDQGIVHRDLKPANIKVRPDGMVKVLDFGLAKALTAEAGNTAAGLTQSPTLTVQHTQAGVILGTAAYMSPEQAAGKPVDRRSDLWAFGVVLMEMLTGQPVFAGETVSHVLASVLKSEPDWTALPSETPASIRRLLRRCLEKDRRQRLSDASAARLEIQDALTTRTEPGEPSKAVSISASRRGLRLAWGLAVLFAIAAIGMGTTLGLRREPAALPVYRLQLALPPDLRITGQASTRLLLSPNGRYVAFLAAKGNNPLLWVRALDSVDVRPLEGTDGVGGVAFWSPDSRSIAFVARGQLKKIELAGGPAIKICDAPSAGSGGSWSPDGVILFGSTAGTQSTPLRRVPASGGTPEPATILDTAADESTHSYPFFLPDGRHFLYRAFSSTSEERGVFLASLDSKERTLLIPRGSNVAYANGYLLFLRETTLMAQPFDLSRLALDGEPAPVAEQLEVGGASGQTGAFSVSQTGLLAYHTGTSIAEASRLTWIDRSGKISGAIGPPAIYRNPRLSPDESQIAVELVEGSGIRNRDIWLMDVAREIPARFTSDRLQDVTPVWSPDGRTIAFVRNPQGGATVLLKPSTGLGNESKLLESKDIVGLSSWAAGGHLFFEQRTSGKLSLWTVPVDKGPTPTELFDSAFNSRQGFVSPDGHSIAYVSNESGTNDVYVQTFPEATGKWRVSRNGGIQPAWRDDGKELFYLAPDGKLMASPIAAATSGGTRFGESVPLFDTHVEGGGVPFPFVTHQYDVARGGQKFLVNELVQNSAAADPFVLMVNWTSALRHQ